MFIRCKLLIDPKLNVHVQSLLMLKEPCVDVRGSILNTHHFGMQVRSCLEVVQAKLLHNNAGQKTQQALIRVHTEPLKMPKTM